MSRLKRLIHEIHRRSLWQVLSFYLLSSWIALQVADTVTATLGLPDWVPSVALVILIVGLPIVLATAFVQEGVGDAAPRSDAPREAGAAEVGEAHAEKVAAHRNLLTWRNAIVAGISVLAMLAVSAGGFMGLRAAGVGPFATLMSAGVLEERDRIVLADFENHTSDSLLSLAATELFRTALSQSPVVNVADQQYVGDVLRRMELEPGTLLDSELATEVAIREGLKAVVTGEIISLGAGYVVSTQLIAVQLGEVLWTDSETAQDPAELIDAVDELSRRLREQIGESLRTIRPTEPLSRVTTSSLEALKKYSLAERAIYRQGDMSTGIRFAEEAVELDTLFVRGYRMLGNAYWISGAGRSKGLAAWKKAFDLRDGLPDRERYDLEGHYYRWGTEEFDKALAAYDALLAMDPDYNTNNLGTLYNAVRDFERAEAVFDRILEEADSVTSSAHYYALATAQAAQGKMDEARRTMELMIEKLPDNRARERWMARVAIMQGDYDEAEAQIAAWRERFSEDSETRATTGWRLATLARLRGRIAEAHSYMVESMEVEEQQGWSVGVIRNAVVQGDMDRNFRGDTAAAIETVDAALARWPLDSIPMEDRPYDWLIEFYAASGQSERARDYLAKRDDLEGRIGRRSFERGRRFALGNIALAEGRVHEAIEEFRKADELLACTFCYYADIAWAYELAGEPDSALTYYERYITTPWRARDWLDSWWLARAFERLGDLYEQRGDAVKATYYYGKFVELWQDADPELQPRVAAALRAINALSTDR
jgi:tetratricopeptide (TPR) repeat protein